MNYKNSRKILRKKLKKNKNLTKNEWDEFANKNNLYSSITLMVHTNTYSWEELKNRIL